MKSVIVPVLFAILAGCSAKPTTIIGLPNLAYAASLVPAGGAPVGADGRVIDTPEVTIAKVQHAAAHANERTNLANEAAKSADDAESAMADNDNQQLARILAGSSLTLAALLNDPNDDGTSAPVGSDGRVVDTPAVNRARAEHVAAHLNEQLSHANEAVRNSGLIAFAAPSAVTLSL